MQNDKLYLNDYVLMTDYILGTDSSQTYALKEALKIMDNDLFADLIPEIIDLGCGDGNSYDGLKASSRIFNWTGLDIESSPEVNKRKRSDLNFMAYDGVNIPFEENSVDMVYSHQVFEHVRYPHELINEVYRVVKPNGYFVGSVSHLEPFHSRSFWNITPYGFITLLNEAGFNYVTVMPGIDCLTLILRRLMATFRIGDLLNPFFKLESPLNIFIEIASRLLRVQTKKRNALKLLYSGHFIFIAKK